MEEKYGKADRVENGIHYYADIGLRLEGGKLVAVIIGCGSKAF